MTKSTKGFYTVEAAIFLPLVILAVLTLGYFLKADAAWENSMHAVYDECSYSQAVARSNISTVSARLRIKRRLNENRNIDYKLTGSPCSYSDGTHTNLNALYLRVNIHLALPLGFDRNFEYGERIKYRDFVGLKYDRPVLGAEGLESDEGSHPVWVFPQSGTKYHKKNCTYVKAAVHAIILTGSVKRRFDSCNMCNSGGLPIGSIVFCFSGDDTCYHKGSCRSIKRHTVVIDKTEAEEKGYTPCSKCGG